jgi:RNA polymerase sigma factor (sigma-70 family)
MTTHQRQPRLHSGRPGQDQRTAHGRRRGPHLSPIAAGAVRTAEQLRELWAAYLANRADWRLRDRLVEHYAPWVRDLAAAIAHRMALRDEDNAVGEALAALVDSILPDFDGHGDFRGWARICIQRKLIDQQRAEQNAAAMFVDLPSGPDELDLLPSREQPRCDIEFLALTAELSDKLATILWLRHYRGLSVAAVAALLKTSPGSVKARTHDAVVALRKKLGGVTRTGFARTYD